MFLQRYDLFHIHMPYGRLIDQWNMCVCVCARVFVFLCMYVCVYKLNAVAQIYPCLNFYMYVILIYNCTQNTELYK
jgi:hypothetical protein